MSTWQMTPIPAEVLVVYRLRFKRRIAATLIVAMAETDASFDYIAKRVGGTPDDWRGYIHALIEGKGSNGLDAISDFLLALECELVVTMQRLAPPQIVADKAAEATP